MDCTFHVQNGLARKDTNEASFKGLRRDTVNQCHGNKNERDKNYLGATVG